MASRRPKPKSPSTARGNGPQKDFGDRLRAAPAGGAISKNAASKRAAQKRRSRAAKQEKSLEPSGYLNEASNHLKIGEGPLQYKFRDDYEPNASTSAKTEASSSASSDGDSTEPQQDTKQEAENNQDEEDFISFDFEDSDDDDSAPQSELALRFAKYEQEEREEEARLAQQSAQRVAHFVRSSPVPQSIDSLPIWPSPWHKPSSIESSTAESSFTDHLTKELMEFAKYVAPLDEEVRQRNALIGRVKHQVQILWRNAELKVFGSFPMGVYLPGADVDLVVVSPEQSIGNKRKDMFRLGDRIRRNGWAQKVDVLSHARVPIIKFTDHATQLDVDISFEQMTGPQAVETVNFWMAEEPALQPLTLLVKQFLRRRKLNDPSLGGLGGYATVCLVKSMLKTNQHIRMGAIDPFDNLGMLLLEFFELYGRQFNYKLHAVNLFGDMEPLMKRANINMQTSQIDGLAIQDPNDPNNNVARATHNFSSIRREFAHAADLLRRLCSDYSALSLEERKSMSLLAPLLKCTPADVKLLASRHEAKTEGSALGSVRNRPAREDLFPPRPPPSSSLPPKPRAPASSDQNSYLPLRAARRETRKKHPLLETFEEGQSSSESEDDIPRKPKNTPPAKKQKTMRPPPSSGRSERRGSDSEDSRTKASSSSKRDYWKAKGGELWPDTASTESNGRSAQSNSKSPKSSTNAGTKTDRAPQAKAKSEPSTISTEDQQQVSSNTTSRAPPRGQPKTQTKAQRKPTAANNTPKPTANPKKTHSVRPNGQPSSQGGIKIEAQSNDQSRAQPSEPADGLNRNQRRRRRKADRVQAAKAQAASGTES